MPISTINTNSIADDAVTVPKVTDQVLTHRNLIINGAMQVNQRNTSTTGTSAFNTDRFKQEYSGGTCTFSWETLSTGSPYDAGFRKFSRLTNTATASATSNYRQFRYTVEAQDVETSGWVYTDPNSYITISFWVRSSIAGKYTFTVQTTDGTAQNYNYSRTLVADTWTKVTETVPGHANLQIDNDNGAGLFIHFRAWLGSNYTSATSEDAWVTYTASTISESGIANWAGTTNATFDLTGVQLEVGETATPFEHRSYGDELARCQRYYQKHGNETSAYRYLAAGYCNSTSQMQGVLTLPVTMRAAPTASVSGNFQILTGSANAAITLNTKQINESSIGLEGSGSGFVANSGAIIRGSNDATAQLKLDAEL